MKKSRNYLLPLVFKLSVLLTSIAQATSAYCAADDPDTLGRQSQPAPTADLAPKASSIFDNPTYVYHGIGGYNPEVVESICTVPATARE